MAWVNVKDDLPKHNQQVHILAFSPYGRHDEIRYDTAIFKKGKIPKKGEAICSEDQHGNNLKPYGWFNPPMSWSGQDVLYWEAIEEPTDLKSNPEYKKRVGYHKKNQERFKEQFKDFPVPDYSGIFLLR